MQKDYDITLIRNIYTDEDGREKTTYGLEYTDKSRTITVKHLSTHRSDVEFLISALQKDGIISALDDILEDFVS